MSLMGTSRCAAAWRNIPETAVSTVSPAGKASEVAAKTTNCYYHAAGLRVIDISLSN